MHDLLRQSYLGLFIFGSINVFDMGLTFSMEIQNAVGS